VLDTLVQIQSEGGESWQERVRVDNGVLSIGRHFQNGLCLDSDLVSRHHARVELLGDRLRVEDASSNGTLAGEMLLRRRAMDVPYGTPIKVGNYTLRIEGARAPSPTPVPPPKVIVEEEPTAEAAAEGDVGLRREIHKLLLENLDLATMDPSKLDDPSMRPRVLTALRRIVKSVDARLPANVDRDALIGELADEALGLGPLERFLADPGVSEIMVIDPSTIYVESGGRLVKTEARFTDDERVRAVIERIVTPLGRRID